MAVLDEDFGTDLTLVEGNGVVRSCPVSVPGPTLRDLRSLYERERARADRERARADAGEARAEELRWAEVASRSDAGAWKSRFKACRGRLSEAVEETKEARRAARDVPSLQAEVARLETLLSEAGIGSNESSKIEALRKEVARLRKALTVPEAREGAVGPRPAETRRRHAALEQSSPDQKDTIRTLRKDITRLNNEVVRRDKRILQLNKRLDREKQSTETIRETARKLSSESLRLHREVRILGDSEARARSLSNEVFWLRYALEVSKAGKEKLKAQLVKLRAAGATLSKLPCDEAVNGGAKRDHRGGVRRDHLAAAGLSPSPWEGPAFDAACPQQADAAARAGGACGPTGSSVGWVVGSVRRRGLTPAALVEPVALAIHLEDVDVVGEAVEESAGKPLGAEHLGPFVEGQIGGDQGRAPLVSLAEHLEQELGAGLGQRHEAEFVDDQKLVGGELLLEPQQLLVIAGLDEFVDQCGGGDEADREALLAGRQAETEGDVGLAGAAVAERDEVLAALDVLAAGQLQDQRLVERGDDLEVEAIEALDHGEARRLDAPLDHAALAVDELELGKTQKIANVVDAFRGTLPGDLVVLPQERRQLQPLEVVDEQHLPCVGHAPSPDSRLMYDLADVVATRARGRYG